MQTAQSLHAQGSKFECSSFLVCYFTHTNTNNCVYPYIYVHMNACMYVHPTVEGYQLLCWSLVCEIWQVGGNDGSCFLKSILALCVAYDSGMALTWTVEYKIEGFFLISLAGVWPGLDLSIIDFGLMNKILTLSVASLRWINIGLYKILPLIYIFSPNVWTEWLGSCVGPGFSTWLLCTGNFPILWTHTHAQTFFNLFHTLSKFLMCKAGWSNQKHRYCWFRVHHPLWFTHARGFSGK